MTRELGIPLFRYAGAERTTYIIPGPIPRQVRYATWTNREEEKLREVIAARLSASKAAGILRRSRNSCIGKANRLGLQFKSRGQK